MRLDRFWLFHRNIDRLESERDFRKLRIAIGGTAPEAAQKIAEDLKNELGDVAVFDLEAREASQAMGAKLDSAGLADIANMGSW